MSIAAVLPSWNDHRIVSPETAYAVAARLHFELDRLAEDRSMSNRHRAQLADTLSAVLDQTVCSPTGAVMVRLDPAVLALCVEEADPIRASHLPDGAEAAVNRLAKSLDWLQRNELIDYRPARGRPVEMIHVGVPGWILDQEAQGDGAGSAVPDDDQVLDDVVDREMWTETVLITPALAGELLASSRGNRHMSEGHVSSYAKEMAEGRWRLTHQSIAIDWDGHLGDGHHRLSAVRRAGVDVPMLVAHNLDPAAFPVFDTGKGRSAGDVLSMTGKADPKNLGAAARLLHLYENDLPTGGSTSRLTNEAVMDIVAAEPTLPDALRRAGSLRSLGMTLSAGAVGMLLTTRANPALDQDPWFTGVKDGAGLGLDDPRLAFRQAFVFQRKARRTSGATKVQVAWYVKAWNAWATEKPMRRIRLGKGEHPMPVTV
ncbi:MAG: hypothetical protein ACRD0J_00150 [Acidimicrobiales bacterium]